MSSIRDNWIPNDLVYIFDDIVDQVYVGWFHVKLRHSFFQLYSWATFTEVKVYNFSKRYMTIMTLTMLMLIPWLLKDDAVKTSYIENKTRRNKIALANKDDTAGQQQRSQAENLLRRYSKNRFTERLRCWEEDECLKMFVFSTSNLISFLRLQSSDKE